MEVIGQFHAPVALPPDKGFPFNHWVGPTSSLAAAEGIRRIDHATTLYPQKLALTLPTSGCCSVGIVRSGTKATELVFL
jgi:hypothetical protein